MTNQWHSDRFQTPPLSLQGLILSSAYACYIDDTTLLQATLSEMLTMTGVLCVLCANISMLLRTMMLQLLGSFCIQIAVQFWKLLV